MDRIGRIVAVLVIALAAQTVAAQSSAAQPGAAQLAKNVIFMLSDGTGTEAWALTRWVAGGRLASDEILSGAVRTYGADSIITDSAPGATAYATGQKGSDKGLAVYPWSVTVAGIDPRPELRYVPLPTVLEGARLSGRATGLVATSNIQHASPAAFSSHWPDRDNYLEIAEQQVYGDIDVVLSGGERYLLPKGRGEGSRADGEDLVEVLKSRGYAYVRTRDELLAARAAQAAQGGRAERLFGMFAGGSLSYEADRQRYSRSQPSLAEMAKIAIETLSGGPKGRDKGFFLFIEGSKVDWAAHANDPAGLYSELKAYDDAVKVALDFARASGDTLVISVSDHGNGGVSIGTREDSAYSRMDDDTLAGTLRKAKVSAETLAVLLQRESTAERIRAVCAEYWGISDLSEKEVASLKAGIEAANRSQSAAEAFVNTLGPLLSSRAKVGWSASGHTGGDVFLFSFGPGRPIGLWENTDIGKLVAAAMGFDFAELGRRLFVEAESAFRAEGFVATLDKGDPANPVLVVTRAGSAGTPGSPGTARLPLAKNLLLVRGRTFSLEGIVVHAEKIGKVFVPRQAIDIVKAEL